MADTTLGCAYDTFSCGGEYSQGPFEGILRWVRGTRRDQTWNAVDGTYNPFVVVVEDEMITPNHTSCILFTVAISF